MLLEKPVFFDLRITIQFIEVSDLLSPLKITYQIGFLELTISKRSRLLYPLPRSYFVILQTT